MKFPWILSNCHDSCKIVLALYSFFYIAFQEGGDLTRYASVSLIDTFQDGNGLGDGFLSSAVDVLPTASAPSPVGNLKPKMGYSEDRRCICFRLQLVWVHHIGETWLILVVGLHQKKWKTWTYNSNNSKRSNILMLSMSTYSGIEFWTS